MENFGDRAQLIQSYIYLLMELSKEGSLYSKMKLERKFSEKRTARFMRNILEAIDYLHSQKPPILHRDLKPENLLMFDGETVKLTDFGWSAQNDEIRNTFCGTQEYLAPEMIRGTGHNEKLDIWTIGVLLFEMVHGKTPFYESKGMGDVRLQRKLIEKRILEGHFKIDEAMQVPTKRVIMAMLHPDPVKRPSAHDLLTNFQFFSQSRTSTTRSRSITSAPPDNSEVLKELEKMRLQMATLNQINQKLQKENDSLKNRIWSSKSSGLMMEIEVAKKKNEGLALEVEMLKEQNSDLRKDLTDSQREVRKLQKNLLISRETSNNQEKDLGKLKDLNVYLFKHTKVGLTAETGGHHIRVLRVADRKPHIGQDAG